MFPACHPGPVNQAQTISNTIKQFRENVPDYVASGFVDLSTGMLLDVDTVANHPREILDVVAAATAHLFEGRNVVQIEGLWKQYRGHTEGGHYFKEILVNSDHLVHLFMRSASDLDIAAVVICTREVSVGMLFAQARQVMREYEAASSEPRQHQAAHARAEEPGADGSGTAGPEADGTGADIAEADGAEACEYETAGAEALAPSRD